jgi:hypothetical protein
MNTWLDSSKKTSLPHTSVQYTFLKKRGGGWGGLTTDLSLSPMIINFFMEDFKDGILSRAVYE